MVLSPKEIRDLEPKDGDWLLGGHRLKLIDNKPQVFRLGSGINTSTVQNRGHHTLTICAGQRVNTNSLVVRMFASTQVSSEHKSSQTRHTQRGMAALQRLYLEKGVEGGFGTLDRANP